MNISNIDGIAHKLLKDPSQAVEIATTTYCLTGRPDLYYGIGAAGLVIGLVVGVLVTKLVSYLRRKPAQ
jgi:hypothetical protein